MAANRSVATAGASDDKQSRARETVTVFLARKIITMDPGWAEATAVAVRDGRILSVGSLDDFKPWLEGARYRIDDTFANRVLMPGFIDPHQHVILAAITARLPNVAYFDTLRPDGPPLTGVRTRDEVIARLTDYAARGLLTGDVLLAWGYDATASGDHLTSDVLDRVSREVPVLVWDCSVHHAYANSAFLRSRRLDESSNGQFLGTNAAYRVLLPAIAPMLAGDGGPELLRYGVRFYQMGGITTIAELAFGGFGIGMEEALLPAVYNDPATPLRAVAVAMESVYVAEKGERAVEHVKNLRRQSTDKFIYDGVKFFSDDAFLSFTMRVGAPGYVDGHQGIWLTEPAQLYERMLPWWRAGFHIHVHSNGEESQDVVLDTLARLMEAKPRFDHRFTFEHYGLSRPAQARRLGALGAAASVNPSYVNRRAELSEAGLGIDRAHLAARLKTLVREGVPTALHTDTPVAPALPLTSVWTAVNRFGQSGKVMGPEERVSIEEALRMITVDAAYVLGVDHLAGSIEPGKFADFTVLERSPYEVAPQEIKDISIWGTVLGGRVFPLRAE
jgi:predicted amidohydrolase YtcJ